MYRVVLIDDERFILVSLEKRIQWEEHGFEVAGKAASVEEGISMIHKLRPDVVFTDIKMPGKDGIEMMKEIHPVYPNIRFVILSGYAEFAFAKAAMEHGASGYCVKPFEEDEIYDILAKIKLALDQSGHNQNEIVDYLGCKDAQALAAKENILQHVGISQNDFKVAVYLGKGSGFETKWKGPMLHFAVNGQSDGYIVNLDLEKENDLIEAKSATKSRYNLKHIPEQFLDLDLTGSMGVSRAFQDITELEDVMEEARIAYYQFFICESPNGLYTGEDSYGILSEWLKKVNRGIECSDLAGIHNLFLEINWIFAKKNYTVETAYRIYNSLMNILAPSKNQENEHCTNMEELVLRYSHIKEMFSDFEDALISQMLKKELREGPIYQILDYINRNYYMEDISIQTISQHFGFNPNYVSQLFKKNLRDTFTAYLSRIRMEHAEQLLKFGKESIGEIAEKVGFSDYFYFAKVFKKYFGTTPSDYRKQMLGEGEFSFEQPKL